MKTYIFDTEATMKPHNSEKYWIDRDYIPREEITAESLNDALKQYREYVTGGFCNISANALKTKQPMYRGDEQCGYVITGKVLICDRGAGVCCEQYIDLWVSITAVQYFSAFD